MGVTNFPPDLVFRPQATSANIIIDEFRVDVQTDQDQAEQKFAWQQQQEGHSAQDSWQDNDWSQTEMEIPLQQLVQTVDGGISLRV